MTHLWLSQIIPMNYNSHKPALRLTTALCVIGTMPWYMGVVGNRCKWLSKK